MKKKKTLYLYTLVLLLPLLCYFGYSFSSKNSDDRVDINNYFFENRSVFLDSSSTVYDENSGSAVSVVYDSYLYSFYYSDISFRSCDLLTQTCYKLLRIFTPGSNKSLFSGSYILSVSDYSFIYTYFIYIVKINFVYIALYGVLALPKVILHYVKKIGDL